MDKCAQMEEVRKLPGEEHCANIDSDDNDESTSQKKGKDQSKKWKDKAVMTIEGSSALSTSKKAKGKVPGKEAFSGKGEFSSKGQFSGKGQHQ